MAESDWEDVPQKKGGAATATADGDWEDVSAEEEQKEKAEPTEENTPGLTEKGRENIRAGAKWTPPTKFEQDRPQETAGVLSQGLGVIGRQIKGLAGIEPYQKGTEMYKQAKEAGMSTPAAVAAGIVRGGAAALPGDPYGQAEAAYNTPAEYTGRRKEGYGPAYSALAPIAAPNVNVNLPSMEAAARAGNVKGVEAEAAVPAAEVLAGEATRIPAVRRAAGAVAEIPGKALDSAGNPLGAGLSGEEMLTKGVRPRARAQGWQDAIQSPGVQREIQEYNAHTPIKGVEDLHDAIEPMKQKLWNEKVQPALDRQEARPIDPAQSAKASKAVRDAITPEMRKFDPAGTAQMELLAKELDEARTVREASNLQKYANRQLDSYFAKYPTARRADLAGNPDTMGWETARRAIREELNTTMENVGETEAAPARKDYGHLTTIEKELERKINPNERKNPTGLYNFLGTAGGLTALLTGHGPLAAAIYGYGRLAEHFNKPDVLVRRGIAKMNPPAEAPFTPPEPYHPWPNPNAVEQFPGGQGALPPEAARAPVQGPVEGPRPFEIERMPGRTAMWQQQVGEPPALETGAPRSPFKEPIGPEPGPEEPHLAPIRGEQGRLHIPETPEEAPLFNVRPINVPRNVPELQRLPGAGAPPEGLAQEPGLTPVRPGGPKTMGPIGAKEGVKFGPGEDLGPGLGVEHVITRNGERIGSITLEPREGGTTHVHWLGGEFNIGDRGAIASAIKEAYPETEKITYDRRRLAKNATAATTEPRERNLGTITEGGQTPVNMEHLVPPGVNIEHGPTGSKWEGMAPEIQNAIKKQQVLRTMLKKTGMENLKIGDTFVDDTGEPRRVMEITQDGKIHTADGSERTFDGAIDHRGEINSPTAQLARGGKFIPPTEEATETQKKTIEPIEYTKPMKMAPSKLRPEAGMSEAQVHHHELAHAIIGALNGLEPAEIASHRHPMLAARGATAAVMYDLTAFKNPRGYMRKVLGDFDKNVAGPKETNLSDMFAAGAAADELINGINRDKNPGLGGDKAIAQKLFDSLGIERSKHQELWNAAVDRAKEKLTPQIVDVIKDEATRREDNLPVELHYSANRVKHIIERVRNLNENAKQAQPGVEAGTPGEGGRGSEKAVAGAEGAGTQEPRGAAAQEKLKPFKPPQNTYKFTVDNKPVELQAMNRKLAWKKLDKMGGYVEAHMESETKPEIGPPVQVEPMTKPGEEAAAKPEKFGPEDVRISTRTPTALRATENGHENPLTIDMNAVYKAKDLPQKLADTVKKYPGMKEVMRDVNMKDPKAVMNAFIEHVAKNLEWLHGQMPPEVRDVTRKWYESANKMSADAAEKYNVDHKQMAGATAALSPQKDWNMNVSLANRVADTLKNHADEKFTPEMQKKLRDLTGKDDAGKIQNEALKGLAKKIKGKSLNELTDPYEKAGWIRLYDEAHNPRAYDEIAPDGRVMGKVKKMNGETSDVAWGDLGSIRKAVSILEDGSRDNISRQLGEQHKVRNFYNNIIDPNSEHPDVTIDTHAVAAGLISPLSGNSVEVAHNFGGPSSSITGSNGTYPLHAEAYRIAAKRLGLRPRELQSIVWEQVRDLFPDTFKTAANAKKVAGIWGEYGKGSLTIDQARQKIVDLAGGFKKPEWAQK